MCSTTWFWLFLIVLLNNGPVNTRKIPFSIGAIFHISDDELERAFKLAVENINAEYNSRSSLKGTTVRHDGRNALGLSQKICNLLTHGVRTIISTNSLAVTKHISSICIRKDITQVLMRSYPNDEYHNYFTVNLYPHPPMVESIFLDLLKEFNWMKFMIIYQDDESLAKIHQLTSYRSSKYDIKLRQLVLDNRNSYRKLLNEIKNSGETYFVVVCDLATLKQFLQQAQQVGLLTEKHHYLIYNFDMDNIDMEHYQYGGCDIISVRFFNPSSPEIMTAIKLLGDIESQQRTLNLETALVIDAVHLIHSSLKEMPQKFTNDQLLHCNDTDSWWHGTSFLNYIKMANFRGCTGLVKFDAQGYRSEFEAEIIELTTKGLEPIGVWNSTTGLKIARSVVEENKTEEDISSLVGQHFTVISVLTTPYGLIKNTTTQLYGNDRYEGFGIDLIDALSKMLGFSYTIIVQEDGANGSKDEKTGKWSGMIGKVLDNVTDLAIGDLTITSERENAVDFTHPFMTLGISILYRKPEPVPPSLFMFASPFSPQVWLFLGVAYILVSLSLFILGRLSPSEWQNPYPCIEEPQYLMNQFTFKNSFWFTIGSLMQQGTELAPIGTSTRMLAGVWWFFTLIMVSSYTANLAAFLTVTTLKTPFNNIEELARQKEIKYGAKANGATASFFRDSDKTDYQIIWKYMEKHPEVMVTENNVGVDRVVNENYAFLMESTTIEFVTERFCTLAQIGGQLDEKGYGIAMRKGAPYRATFNTAILKLQETGALTSLKIKWWKEKLSGGVCQERQSTTNVTPLDLKNVGGVFLVLGVGTFLGISMAFLELSLEIFSYIKRTKTKYEQEMKQEMKFFLKFKKNVKPARKFEHHEEGEEGNEFSFNNINYLENCINENNQNE